MPAHTEGDQLARHAATFTVGDMLRQNARVHRNRTAIVAREPETHLTFGELDERVNRLANALAGMGLGADDTVAVLAEPRPEYAEIYFATAKLGVTAAGLNTRFGPRELVHCVDVADADHLFVSDHMLDTMAEIRDDVEFETLVQVGADPSEEYVGYEALLADGSTEDPEIYVSPDNITNILFTSGTTGMPKAAQISQRATVMRALRLVQHLKLDEDDAYLGWLPLYHTGGVENMHAALSVGGKMITMPEVDIEAMLELIEDEEATFSLLLPGVLQPLAGHPDRDEYDLTSFKTTGGYANLANPDTIAEMTEATQGYYIDAFGQTETSWNVACGTFIGPGEHHADYRKKESMFIQMRIVDEEGNRQPQGEPGELVVRGPTVMSGYKNNPEANEDTFEDGWLHTGDVFVRNQDGTLTFVDRKKYLIKSGGENIYPAEVEEVLTSHDAVDEAAVVGVSDEKWGETVKAVVTTREGESVTKEELDQFMRDSDLADFKRPRLYQIVSPDELPRSSTGKIQPQKIEGWSITDDQRVA